MLVSEVLGNKRTGENIESGWYVQCWDVLAGKLISQSTTMPLENGGIQQSMKWKCNDLEECVGNQHM